MEQSHRQQEANCSRQQFQQLQDELAAFKNSQNVVDELKSENEILQDQVKYHKSNHEECYSGLKEEVQYFDKWREARVAQNRMRVEHDKSLSALQNERDELRASNQDSMRKSEVSSLNQKAELLESELNKEKQAHLETKADNELFLKLLTSERDSLRADLSREKRCFTETEASLQKALEEKETALEISQKYEIDLTESRNQVEMLQQEQNNEIRAHAETNATNQQITELAEAEMEDFFSQVKKDVNTQEESFHQTAASL
ncbi:peptide chain release factor 1-like [Nothobranchius furzeri]|uniref:Peptide chain release factor 1-like n=1 Tax=Nothobranchius furzeri TaxID=105023 RepID=A0A9D3BVZ4_NOTFU|nr:peptide chain release factor 1-like [Nothobranchius furzeri]